jgi:hypothetical protein
VLKELGDLYAHRERDKGLIAMRAFLHWAQAEMFTLYKSDEKRQFLKDNDCDWWLRSYLLQCVDRHSGGVLKKNLGASAKSIKREIKNFFPESDFPTILRGAVDVRIIEIAHFFSNYIVIHPVLDSTKISKAANGLLQTCGLRNADQELVDGISICLLLLFQGSSVSIANKLNVTLKMSLEGYSDQQSAAVPGEISVSTAFSNKYGWGQIDLGSPMVSYMIKSQSLIDNCEAFRINLQGVPSTDFLVGFDSRGENPFHFES